MESGNAFGLSPKTLTELACQDTGLNLDGFIQLVVSVDQQLRTKRHHSSHPASMAPCLVGLTVPCLGPPVEKQLQRPRSWEFYSCQRWMFMFVYV